MTIVDFLLDARGEPRSFLSERYIAITAYPTDHVSRDQYFALLVDEEQRHIVEKHDFKSSAFAESTTRQVYLKGLAQKSVAGLVTLVFFVAATKHKTELSQYKATQIVEKLMREMSGNTGRPISILNNLDAGERETITLRAASSRVDIEKRFRRFNAISPLMASQFSIVASEGLTADSTREEMARATFRLAIHIELTVRTVFPQYFPESFGMDRVLSTSFSSVDCWSELGAIGKAIESYL